jgi:hypothetical protein
MTGGSQADTDEVSVGANYLSDPSQFVADYHTHPSSGNPFADIAIEDFSSGDRQNTLSNFNNPYLPNFQGSFLSIPGGIVLMEGSI